MITKNHVIAALAVAATYNEVIAFVNGRRCNRNKALYEAKCKSNEDLHHVLNYYAKKLDDAGVPMETFDEIVVRNLYA